MGCGLFDWGDDPYDREFVFKNYTDKNYKQTRISIGEVLTNNKIKIHKTEYLDVFKKNENSVYSEFRTGKSKDWDEAIYRFLESSDDFGCFIIELSDKRMLFIEITYYEDGLFSGIDNANIYEIKITENELSTSSYANTETLKDIPIAEYSIEE